MNPTNLDKAFQAFDAINAQDPHNQEWLYAQRLTDWVLKLEAQPSDALLLASRCQHLKRWEIPRSSFPEGRVGYLKWRKHLYQFHADEAEKILQGLGYDQALIEKVKAINLKKNLKDADTQSMEDALCLVFLEFQLKDFMVKTAPEKMPGIIQKTWAKMSEKGHDFALNLPFSEEELHLIRQSLKA